MSKLRFRIQTMITLIRLSWIQPGLFTQGTFVSMSNLMTLMLRVAEKGEPMMCRLAMVTVNEQHDIVTVWVGKGANSSPYERIVELRDEVAELKRQLNDQIAENIMEG